MVLEVETTYYIKRKKVLKMTEKQKNQYLKVLEELSSYNKRMIEKKGLYIITVYDNKNQEITIELHGGINKIHLTEITVNDRLEYELTSIILSVRNTIIYS